MSKEHSVIPMPGARIVISGNLGAGKTTLGEKLAQSFSACFESESVESNPYLNDFYQDMSSFAFHLQLYFLGYRVSRYKKALIGGQTTFFDRSVYEDIHVFAPLLHKAGHINDRDFHTYLELAHSITDGLEPPMLVLYLYAPVDILFDRIVERRQSAEHNSVTTDYLEAVENRYEKWIGTIRFCPVIKINTAGVDLRDGSGYENLVEQLRSFFSR